MMRFSFHLCAAFALIVASTAAQAGFNEGDAIPLNAAEFLAVGSFSLIMLPVGFVVARLGFSLLFKILAWFLVLCVLALVVATGLLAGDLGMILVIFAAMLIVPGLVLYLLGGWAGFALRTRRSGGIT